MSFTGASTIKNMKYMPIEHVKIYANGALYQLNNLEKGSVWGIAPVTAPNDKGGSTIVAWDVIIKAMHIENNYKDKAQMLRDFATNKISDIDLILRALSGTDNGAYMWISIDSRPEVCDWDLKFKIDGADERPRLIVDITGTWSSDAFETIENIEYFFSQLGGFD